MACDLITAGPYTPACPGPSGQEFPHPSGEGTLGADPHAPRGARAQNASGAGRRFALAGAKCERRLPARYGPAPEVPTAHRGAAATRTPPDRGIRTPSAPGRAADTPTCVYAETETADTVSGASWARAWWDVPVAETATRPSPVTAHELDERHVSTRRRHL